MIPIACKITIFSLYLFVYFLKAIIEYRENMLVKRVPQSIGNPQALLSYVLSITQQYRQTTA